MICSIPMLPLLAQLIFLFIDPPGQMRKSNNVTCSLKSSCNLSIHYCKSCGSNPRNHLYGFLCNRPTFHGISLEVYYLPFLKVTFPSQYSHIESPPIQLICAHNTAFSLAHNNLSPLIFPFLLTKSLCFEMGRSL